MKKYFVSLSSMIALMIIIVMPQFALAHEHQIFKINGKYYQFTVGFLNEPVAVALIKAKR